MFIDLHDDHVENNKQRKTITMKYKYDMHIATEAGDTVAVKKAIIELGFQDDNLADRSIIYDVETARHYTCCPAIVVHSSKKVESHPELRDLEIEVVKIMEDKYLGVIGYWHSECVLDDRSILSTLPFSLKPLPFEPLISRPRDEEKVWDIHLSMRESFIPPYFKELLIKNGIYYIARLKKLPEGGEARFAVFTVQGINQRKDGEVFYQRFCEWLLAVGAPRCDIKLELTTAMRLHGSPKNVPPTIETIEWR